MNTLFSIEDKSETKKDMQTEAHEKIQIHEIWLKQILSVSYIGWKVANYHHMSMGQILSEKTIDLPILGWML